jgi:hypothetical protein
MSRIATGDRVTIAPSNNVYTVLLAVATVLNILGFVIIFLRYAAVFGAKSNLFQP